MGLRSFRYGFPLLRFPMSSLLDDMGVCPRRPSSEGGSLLLWLRPYVRWALWGET